MSYYGRCGSVWHLPGKCRVGETDHEGKMSSSAANGAHVNHKFSKERDGRRGVNEE